MSNRMFPNFGGWAARSGAASQYPLSAHRLRVWPVFVRVIVVVLMVVGGLVLDEVTPQMVSVGIFYVATIFTGFWFPKPAAAIGLALLATFLIVIGYWTTTSDIGTVWEVWTNRVLTIGTVWLTALFVWYIRVLEERLRKQIEITSSLSREISHRVGNSLQIVASFLRLQAARGANEESQRILQAASSRVMAVGRIERMLAHSGPGHTVDSSTFLTALVSDIRSASSDPGRIEIAANAESTELTSSMAIPLGACLIELINNALKHAFHDGSKGNIAVRFMASPSHYTVEVEDDGAGIDETRHVEGFGTQNVAELARLMRGTISHRPARSSAARPGTVWRLVIQRD